MEVNAWCVLFALLLGLGIGWFCAGRYRRKHELARAQFLSFVAHELNSPLTSLNMTVMNFVQGTFGPIEKEHEPWFRMMFHLAVMFLAG